MTTDYNKTNGHSPTTRKLTGHNLRKTRVCFRSDHHTHQYTHCQHNFYKHHTDGRQAQHTKWHTNCMLLPEDIVFKITQRNNIRRANTCDPALKLLNEEITSDIQKHKQNIWKKHVNAHWDHRHNTHTLWKTIHGLSNRAPPTILNKSITFHNKVGNTPKTGNTPLTEQHKTYKVLTN